MANTNKPNVPNWLLNQPIAHRGLHDNISPENSLSAFSKAVASGYAIEMDVHLTTDNVLVVFHDDTLNRMSDGFGKVCEHSWEQLKKLKLTGSNEGIPTFNQLLETVNGQVPLLIEIKPHSEIGKLEQFLTDALKQYKGEFAVQSFNPFIIKWFANNVPEFTRGQLASYCLDNSNQSKFNQWMLKNCYLNFLAKPQFVSYNIENVRRCNRLKTFNRQNKAIILWTARSQQQLDDCTKDNIKFHNFIFENFIPRK